MKGSSIGQYAYGTSKAAFIQLTRMLATTFAEAKVRVNSIAPGIFPSEMTAGSSNENQKSELKMNFSIPAGSLPECKSRTSDLTNLMFYRTSRK